MAVLRNAEKNTERTGGRGWMRTGGGCRVDEPEILKEFSSGHFRGSVLEHL